MLHGQLLGTGKLLNGSVLTFLCESGHFGPWIGIGKYDDILQRILRKAFTRFHQWLKTCKMQCSQPRFTPGRLSRRLRSSFPCLSAKGAQSKTITFWLSQCAVAHAQRDGATDLDREVATCIWSYARSLQIMEESPTIMSAEAASEFHKATMTHLLTYSSLHKQSAAMKGSVLNRCLWMLAPKHHFYQHLAQEVLQNQCNPKNFTLMAGESFIGDIGRISKACHRTTVSMRAAQRYLIILSFKLKSAEAMADLKKPRIAKENMSQTL